MREMIEEKNKERIEENFPELKKDTAFQKCRRLPHAKESEWKRHSPTYIMVKFQNPKDEENPSKTIADHMQKNKNQIYIRLLIINTGCQKLMRQ